jgi:hypothetical protein
MKEDRQKVLVRLKEGVALEGKSFDERRQAMAWADLSALESLEVAEATEIQDLWQSLSTTERG